MAAQFSVYSLFVLTIQSTELECHCSNEVLESNSSIFIFSYLQAAEHAKKVFLSASAEVMKLKNRQCGRGGGGG